MRQSFVVVTAIAFICFAATLSFAGGDNEVRIAYDANGNIEYVGEASVRAGTDEAKWRIKKITYDANGNVTQISFADNAASKGKVWDDREGYTYD
jgi:hypothetical protein